MAPVGLDAVGDLQRQLAQATVEALANPPSHLAEARPAQPQRREDFLEEGDAGRIVHAACRLVAMCGEAGIDVAVDPADPRHVYAAAYAVRRRRGGLA